MKRWIIRLSLIALTGALVFAAWIWFELSQPLESDPKKREANRALAREGWTKTCIKQASEALRVDGLTVEESEGARVACECAGTAVIEELGAESQLDLLLIVAFREQKLARLAEIQSECARRNDVEWTWGEIKG
jgi:hypothetical protein